MQPKWLTDVLVRAFAEDWMVIAAGYAEAEFRAASDAASLAALPVGWILTPGIPRTEAAAQRMLAEALRLGPPVDCFAGTLASWKGRILAAGRVAPVAFGQIPAVGCSCQHEVA